MARFRHDAKHLTPQQQIIIRKGDERDRMVRQSLEKEKKQLKEVHGEYEITVNNVNGTYEAVGRKGEHRENSYGDTKEDAIKHLKQKIDNIDAYKGIYKEKEE